MTTMIPLITHASPDAVVAYRGGRSISARQFLADVHRVSLLLPNGDHVLNSCEDRYRFAVGLAACLWTKKISLLPPANVPETIRYLREFAPDAVCLTDTDTAAIDLPTVRFPAGFASPDSQWEVPRIPADQRVAYVFTSGSTGQPVPHSKTWAKLVANVHIEADRLGMNDGRRHAIVATVPPQHMYGFESSVLVALQSGQSFCAERPFYPVDIAATLSALPRARILVTTPLHLRAILESDVDLPALELVLCATAPLDAELAACAERRFHSPLLEIYGATETGQLASRRTSDTAEWHLWSGVELLVAGGAAVAQGGHLEKPTPLGDNLECVGRNRFKLHGRNDDLVNIAGKRSSLGYLNHQLTALPGVLDGVFYLRDNLAAASVIGTTRVGAIVVAPGITAETIMDGLRERVDPVFLPRPLLFVDEIPRNSTGKLVRATLDSLVALRESRVAEFHDSVR